MKKHTLILLLTVLALLAGVVFTLTRSRVAKPTITAPSLSIPNETILPDATDGEEQVLEENVTLHFTKVGCTSLPYISALSGTGEERTSTTNISANDGYQYAVVDGTRSARTIVSHFDGTCRDTAPEQMDTFQVIDVGVTQAISS
jgi:Na+-translocating ferredoxin:NAD+ oxidoreductase RnfG subunit